jgi:hypothetical protein
MFLWNLECRERSGKRVDIKVRIRFGHRDLSDIRHKANIGERNSAPKKQRLSWTFLTPQRFWPVWMSEASMEQYLVECHGDAWKVRYEGSHIGIFPSKAAAITWAIQKAHNSLARSVEARVLAEDEKGAFFVVWTSKSSFLPSAA